MSIFLGSICFLSICFTVWLLTGSLSVSAADLLKLGVGSCMIVVAGLGLTLMVFYLMRIGPAKKMTTAPMGPEVIKNHIANL